MASSADILIKFGWLNVQALDLSEVVDRGNVTVEHDFESGTGNNQIDVIWHDRRSINATTNDDLDLTALTQTIYGATVTKTFAKVKAILISNRSTTNSLEIGGSGGNEWSAPFGATGDKVTVPPSSSLVLVNRIGGWAVTNSSADILRVRNAGGTSTEYDIVILGTSA